LTADCEALLIFIFVFDEDVSLSTIVLLICCAGPSASIVGWTVRGRAGVTFVYNRMDGIRLLGMAKVDSFLPLEIFVYDSFVNPCC